MKEKGACTFLGVINRGGSLSSAHSCVYHAPRRFGCRVNGYFFL